MDDEIPAWCWRGGGLRLSNVPPPWKQTAAGKWSRDELVPYGKATEEFRAQYFIFPVCGEPLRPSEREYRFGCTCGIEFMWGHGRLYSLKPKAS